MGSTSRVALVLAALGALAGCGASAQEWVEEHAEGRSVVRGQLVSLEDVSSQRWLELDDGWVVVIGAGRGTAGIQQPASPGVHRFVLRRGDAVALGEDEAYVVTAALDLRPPD